MGRHIKPGFAFRNTGRHVKPGFTAQAFSYTGVAATGVAATGVIFTAHGAPTQTPAVHHETVSAALAAQYTDLPSVFAEKAVSAETAKTEAKYTVVPGDTLSGIAAGHCGNAKDWTGVYKANERVIGADPDVILPGQQYTLSCKTVTVKTVVAQPSVPPASTPVSVTSPVSTVASTVGGTLSCSGLEQLWVSAGGAPGAAFMAAEIAMAESGGNQYAQSPTDDFGYWQINGSHGAQATFDALGNAEAAVAISGDGSNWSPWTTYTTGAYQGRC